MIVHKLIFSTSYSSVKTIQSIAIVGGKENVVYMADIVHICENSFDGNE